MTGSELVPALPEGLGDLEGWTPEELMAWIEDAAQRIDAGEALLERMRLAVGLALWKLRHELGDGSYGLQVEELAGRLGVTGRTLSGWRRDAEEHFGLPAPDTRTAGRRAGVEKASTPTVAPQGIPERVKPSEVLSPAPGPVTRPATSASHTAPRGPRHEQLTLPLEEASTTIEQVSIEELAALPLARLKGMQARIAQALAIASRAPAAARPVLGCTHAKSMLTVLPYLTRCDTEKGGCGAKVR